MGEIHLTPRQREAIETLRKDICVVAGPGAGKTTVLIQRFLRLVASGISPLGILAITFTEKAATQLKQRLIDQFGKQPALRPQIERAYVSTVHGFCARLLRENAIAAGVDPEFRVLDEREAVLIEREAVIEALDALLEERPGEMRSLLAHLASPDLGCAITAVYSAMRAAGVPVTQVDGPAQPPGTPFSSLLNAAADLLARPLAARTPSQLERAREVAEWCARVRDLADAPLSRRHFELMAGFRPGRLTDPRVRHIRDELIPAVTETLIAEFHAPDRRLLLEALRRFDAGYRRRKAALGALDYADLEEYAVALLAGNPEVRENTRGQFEQVLMDELQDTNRQQARLINLVRMVDRFYAVGDINQSIYGFRNADPEVFREYRDQVRAAGRPVIELRENFRSRPEILAAALTILDEAPGIEPHRLVARRSFEPKSEPSVEILAAQGASPDEALAIEAAVVAGRIRELQGALRVGDRTARFEDFAVLVRNSNVVPAFTAAFDAAGIPYQVDRGRGFYEAREVVDLMCLLRVLANPRDEIATAAVLRSPLAGISDEALLRLKMMGNVGRALGEMGRVDLAGFQPNDRERLLGFAAHLARWREERHLVAPDRLMARAMDRVAYEQSLAPRARANVEKLLGMVRQSAEAGPIDHVVAELEALRASAGEPDAAVEDSGRAVPIMTVHSAKGLEFPIVILAGLNKGVEHDPGPICFSPELGLGARWRDPATGARRPDRLYSRIREERQRKEAGESERLFYVAMTRAEEHLVLSFSSTSGSHPEWAGYLERKLGLDLHTLEEDARVEWIEAPGGTRFAVRVATACAAPASAQAPAGPPPASAPAEPARPAIAGQYDSTASVTGIAQFAACPRRYYLARYLGWQGGRPPRIPEEDEAPPERDELDASEFGQQVHALLAGTHAGPATAEAGELARRFRSSALGRRAGRAARAEREFDFLFAVEEVVVRGQIDLWFEENGRLVLVDYKTDAVDAASAAAHSGQYALQLQLYALALERAAGRTPDEAYLYFLRPDVVAPVALQPLFLHSAAAVVREFRQAQESLDFPLRAGPACRKCPFFRRSCPSEG